MAHHALLNRWDGSRPGTEHDQPGSNLRFTILQAWALAGLHTTQQLGIEIGYCQRE